MSGITPGCLAYTRHVEGLEQDPVQIGLIVRVLRPCSVGEKFVIERMTCSFHPQPGFEKTWWCAAARESDGLPLTMVNGIGETRLTHLAEMPLEEAMLVPITPPAQEKTETHQHEEATAL